jgi:hypothetical protein
MRKSLPLLAFLLAVLATAPAIAAEPPAPDAAPAPAVQAQEPAPLPSLEELLLPEPQAASGCTAEIFCQHGGSVSCSSSVGGTCSSSWGGCGQVTCNGTTTRCDGYCVGDHHCWSFCEETYGSFDFYCNSGCCECL